MDEDDYNELFGVTPEDGGEETSAPEADEQTPGDVPESDTATKVGQGEADPAGEQLPSHPGEPGGVPESDTPTPQPEKQDADAPALRTDARVPSPEEAVAQARADAQKAIDEAFALSGLKNPYTGQPITSKAEYDAYKERFERERQERFLQQTGMSQEEFQQFVQGLPEVREARQAREAAEKAVREAREAAARVKVEEQIREISAMDPSVKSLEDLVKMPNYPRFYELVRRGNTLTDAYRLANFDTLAQRAAAGARQAAVNAARSKEHLTETKSRGSGAVSVPAEVREQYKLFNPDATEEEIQRHYQKYHKEENK